MFPLNLYSSSAFCPCHLWLPGEYSMLFSYIFMRYELIWIESFNIYRIIELYRTLQVWWLWMVWNLHFEHCKLGGSPRLTRIADLHLSCGDLSFWDHVLKKVTWHGKPRRKRRSAEIRCQRWNVATFLTPQFGIIFLSNLVENEAWSNERASYCSLFLGAPYFFKWCNQSKSMNKTNT